jgi:pantoate--beta-alanine ligase
MNNVLDTTKWVEMNFRKHPTLKLEYFNIADETNLKTIQKENYSAVVSKHTHKKYRAFIAVFVGNIRLIDNIALY